MDIKKTLLSLPEGPGVYVFYGKDKSTLYIGKASNLKKRVSSYFQKKYHPPRIRALVENIEKVDYLRTAGSEEALIYEAILIKERKPRYNIEFRDDKSYPFLKITLKDRFPGIYVVRGRKKDGSLYFGPYTNARLLRRASALIAGVFGVRTCRGFPKKACLKFHLGRCSAPCAGRISAKDYAKLVEDARLFLDGRKKALLGRLSGRMREASGSLDYERALFLRGQIESLSHMLSGKKGAPPLKRDLWELKNDLALKALPARIEAFDISNIYGKEAVGSMVTFSGGKPRKGEYRRFRIKAVRETDDYAMIREVLKRRYTRVLKENLPLPDLIIIDGGRGHVSTAFRELKKLGLSGVPLIGIAKEKEAVYGRGSATPLKIDKNSRGLKLIMRIRDEAHRFAISYHKLLRKKKFFGEPITP